MDAPINFLGDGANTLSWESPAGVDHYQIDMQSGEDWNNIANPDSSATSVTLEGSFIYGQLYRIRAFDAGGDYADAFWQFFAGPDTPPDSVNLTDVGDGSNVNVAWTWPGGSPSSGRDIPVEGVRVVWSWNNESAFSSGAYQDLTTGDYSTTITGGPGNLKVAVASFNSYSGGASTTAEIDISAPLLPPDGSFGDNVLNDNADGTANLLWTYGPGAQPVDGFRVYWTWNGSSPRESGLSADNGSSANGMTITGGPGNLWAYVVAFNGAGEGEASADVTGTVTDVTGPPGTPTGLTLVSIAADGPTLTATVSWTPPAEMADVVMYEVTGSVGENPVLVYSEGIATSVSFSGSEGDAVEIRVGAMDGVNNVGALSDPLSFTLHVEPDSEGGGMSHYVYLAGGKGGFEAFGLRGITTGRGVFLAKTGAAEVQPEPPTVLDGLQGYWPCESGAAAVGPDLTMGGTVTFSAGKNGNGALFGSSDAILKSSAAPNLTNFTVACWVKAEPNGGYQVYIDNLMSPNGFSLLSYPNGALQLDVLGGTVVTVPGFLTGAYRFLAVTYDVDAHAATVIVDADIYGPATSIVNMSAGGDLCIGNRGIDPSYPSRAADEVGFWTRILTDEELAFLYNGGSGRFYPFS